jgi:hypothetical protein
LCSGFATFVEMAAARPARPAPMTMRWIDIWAESDGAGCSSVSSTRRKAARSCRMRTLTPRSSASDLKQDCHRPRKISSLDRYCNRGSTFDAGSRSWLEFHTSLHSFTIKPTQNTKKIRNGRKSKIMRSRRFIPAIKQTPWWSGKVDSAFGRKMARGCGARGSEWMVGSIGDARPLNP